MKACILFLGCSAFVFVISGLLMGSGPLIVQPPVPGDDPTIVNWLHYGNDLANTRYQNVDQINPSNVANLKVAWVFHTKVLDLSLIHISEPTRLGMISYAVFCLKKKK